MSITQTTPEQNASDEVGCTRCNSVLPPNAAFCSNCGERVNKSKQDTQLTSAPRRDASDATERYRITSLVRRQRYVQLFLAFDTVQQRPVAIRDIDMSSMDEDAQMHALEIVQQEYDVLRRERIADVMPVIDLRYAHGHIFVVAGWPFPAKEKGTEGGEKIQPSTLRDLLQSGIGLPGEEVAVSWLYRLCSAVERLHRLNIVLGDLDASTIVLSDTSYTAVPALMVFWLPLSLRTLLGGTAGVLHGNGCSAPEAGLGTVELRSDVYSLGALLLLLLTGSTPDVSSPGMHRLWRSVRERNIRVTASTEAIVMRALSVDPSNRFQRVSEMSEALLLSPEMSSEITPVRPTNTDVHNKGKHNPSLQNGTPTETVSVDDAEEVTVSVVPLQAQLAYLQLSQLQTDTLNTSTQQKDRSSDTPEVAEAPAVVTEQGQDAPSATSELTPPQLGDAAFSTDVIHRSLLEDDLLPEPMPRQGVGGNRGTALPLMQRFKERFSGILPALSPATQFKLYSARPVAQAHPSADVDASFLRKLHRFLLSEQRRSTTAAALIETPLRVQPNQNYTIRIHVMGRDVAMPPPGFKKGSPPVGLSAMVHDEVVHIEVRSAIYQNYAYIVQRADVCVPGQGYAAEITIPMQPLSEGPGGRRERLHICFMDEMRRPLYEKPFAVEVFVSHLVQSGREGHTVLSIPL